MKEKVDQQRKEKEKLERLTQTSENYQKNAIVIRSRALQGFVDNIKTRQESLEELAALGIDLEAACYRVAVFDLDLYSDGSQLTAEKRQESALMSFVLFNISDEIISKEKAGVAYQAGNNKVGALFMGNRTREFEHKITFVKSSEAFSAASASGIFRALFAISAASKDWISTSPMERV